MLKNSKMKKFFSVVLVVSMVMSLAMFIFAADSDDEIYIPGSCLFTGHTMDVVAAVAPTCSTPGLTEGRSCTVCGYVESKQEEIPADASLHVVVVDASVAPTCTTAGLTEGSHCSVCSEVIVAQEEIAALGHTSSDWIIDTPATEAAEGSQHKECTVCGETLATESIPKLEPQYILGDVTGDGRVNSRDVTKIFRYVQELSDLTATELLAGDVTGDGRVNSRDVTKIFRYVQELTESL